jgi:hypothetical protein
MTGWGPSPAGVVDQLLNLALIAASQPGSVLFVQTNQPLDLRLNSLAATPVCNIVLAPPAAEGGG